MNTAMVNKKIPVGILGATGSVGQKFVELLSDHPWFEIKALAASSKSSGKRYGNAVHWFQSSPLPPQFGQLRVVPCEPDLPCKVVFSGLDSKVAGGIETEFAKAGYGVISNSKNHRMDPDVPLLVPEINHDHLKIVKHQTFGEGFIVTNPNCSTVGMVMALKPLLDQFGLEAVNAVTMQAISGAGYPGVSSLDIMDNVIPYIAGEETKMETEPLKIFGSFSDGKIKHSKLTISAHCNRVAVTNGHLESISVKLKKTAGVDEMKAAWNEFRSEPQRLDLPLAPPQPTRYFDEDNFPQPKIHRNIDKGMAVSVGRLRPCPVLDYKFTVLSHNTIRGAAGGAILNAELMVQKKLIPEE